MVSEIFIWERNLAIECKEVCEGEKQRSICSPQRTGDSTCELYVRTQHFSLRILAFTYYVSSHGDTGDTTAHWLVSRGRTIWAIWNMKLFLFPFSFSAMGRHKKSVVSVFFLNSLILLFMVVILQLATTASSKSHGNKVRKLLVDPSTYETKTITESFMNNPLTYFIMVWMLVHVLLGILFFCYLASERALMKPTSVTL